MIDKPDLGIANAKLGYYALPRLAPIFLGTGIAERAEQSKQAHDDAVQKMEAGMSYAAQQLVLQKFPQIKDHPLNERGKAQVEAVVKEWKEKNDKNMDTVLRVLNGHQGSISDDPVGFARAMLRGGSVDLANKLMQVYYDPRNWQK